MARLMDDGVATLRRDLSGDVLVEGDPGYDEARAVWNGSIDRRPDVIVRCGTAEEVARAVRFARDHDLEISVRGGGHNFAGLAVGDGGLMIHLGGMRGVSVDVAGRRATCGGGATWADLDAAAQEHALAVPGGFVSHTGVAGLTLGGGMGWLTRKYGLSCDNLVGADVVTADGRILHASASEHPDLFWALRGGGGNFGVVTSFEFALHPVGPMLQFALMFWPADQARDALRLSREIVAGLPEEINPFIAGLSLPPAPFVPEQHHFTTGIALLLADFGAPAEHAAVVARVRAALPPLVEFVTPIPYVALQQMFDAGAPWGAHGYEKAVYLDTLSDAAVDVIAEHLTGKTSPLSFMPVFHLGGAFSRIAEGDTAFAGPRRPVYVVNIAAVAPTAEMYDADHAWVRTFWEALQHHAPDTGGYVNFMSEYDDQRVVTAYGREKYDKLARIKAEYDPDNVFHRNMNIRPAASAGALA